MAVPGRWQKIRSFAVVVFSFAALTAIVVGISAALRSSLFLVQVVEVADLPENAPVDAHTISALAAVPIGKVNLYDLRLDEIEKRVLTHVWVREVYIEKRFPQTVVISVNLREPRALLQGESGSIGYVDADGKVFGRVNLSIQPDLPILSGAMQAVERRLAALALLEQWDSSPVGRVAQISSLIYDEERGFRLVISYRFSRQKPGSGTLFRARTMVDLGLETGAVVAAQLHRLERVIRYLADNSIAARQIFADAGKKIVVKITRSS